MSEITGDVKPIIGVIERPIDYREEYELLAQLLAQVLYEYRQGRPSDGFDTLMREDGGRLQVVSPSQQKLCINVMEKDQETGEEITETMHADMMGNETVVSHGVSSDKDGVLSDLAPLRYDAYGCEVLTDMIEYLFVIQAARRRSP